MAEAADIRLPAEQAKKGAMADKIATPMPWRDAPIARQVGVLAVLAMVIAIGVGVGLWSQEEGYSPLFNNLSSEDVTKAQEVLQTMDVAFRIDESTGQLLVPSEKVSGLRMKMAAEGLPRSTNVGLEMLNQEQDLSTSQFVESKRFNRALEIELGRSISSLRSVKSARVHLALPKQSIFVRKRTRPSASVMVDLYQGRQLEPEQIASIVHLVSSSIAHMESGDVTVVDQAGRLLTEASDNKNLAMTAKQFEYRRAIERDYSERIVRLLEPVAGFGKVRAQVTADLDFDRIESTQEEFDPQDQVIRSEQMREQQSRNNQQAVGIPGALTNQPPGAGTTDEASAGEDKEGATPGNQSRSSTRNYEVGKVISHTRKATGGIKRMTVAVVVDDKLVKVEPAPAEAADPAAADQEKAAEGEDAAAEGEEESAPAAPAYKREAYTEAELANFTQLVKASIGFDEARGDTISLINTSFQLEEIEAIPELPIWEQLWFQDLIKQVLAGIFILLLLLMIVRPILRGLIPESGEEGDDEISEDDENAIEGVLSENTPVQWTADGRPMDPLADARNMEYDKKINYARILVNEDPGRAANVMKLWLEEAGVS